MSVLLCDVPKVHDGVNVDLAQSTILRIFALSPFAVNFDPQSELPRPIRDYAALSKQLSVAYTFTYITMTR